MTSRIPTGYQATPQYCGAMLRGEDKLATMKHEMPPSGGMGMGIGQLLMALVGSGIR